VFGVSDPEPWQETALEQGPLVVVADDRKVAVGAADEAKIVAGGADVLAADNEPSGFRSAVAAVAVQWQVLPVLDLRVAEVGERGHEQPAIFEDDLGVSEILRHERAA
jgi:hypothetical protein